MSDLRAPDPTLTALDGSEELSIQERGDGGCDIAHLYVKHPEPPDWRGPLWWTIDAERARWFAVPCRECFPGAPPPGQRTHGGDCPPDDLAWQVQP